MPNDLSENVTLSKRNIDNSNIKYSLADDGEYDLGDIWEEATIKEEKKKEALSKKTIFNKARKKIKEKYAKERTSGQDLPEDISHDEERELQEIDICEKHDLWNIDYLEKCSVRSLKESIKNRIECIWKYFLTEEGRIAWGIGLFLLGLNLFFALCIIGKYPFVEQWYFFIHTITETAFYTTVCLAASFLWSVIKREIKQKSTAFYISWLLAFLLCIPHIPVLCNYETTDIGSYYEATEYTAKYYVIMSREPETNPNRKAYTLPAEIERRLDEGAETFHSSTYYLDGETYEQDVSTPSYHINYLYFPNGGYLTFTYDEAYEEPDRTDLLLNEETMVADYHGDEYYITLTNKKAE